MTRIDSVHKCQYVAQTAVSHSVGWSECTCGCLISNIDAGVLQVVRSQEFLNRLSQVVFQQASDQLVVLQVQRAVY